MVGAHTAFTYIYILYRKKQGPAQGQILGVKTMTNIKALNFTERYKLLTQRRYIRKALDHIKHPTRPISNHDLEQYLYHLNIIAELTIDGKTSRAAAKIREITRRYLQYRFRNQPSRFNVVQDERPTLRRSKAVARKGKVAH